MRPLIIVILFIIWCSILQAQTETIHGKIVEANTDNPIPMADIYIKNSTIGTSSDSDGLFDIKIRPERRDDSLVVRSMGFTKYTQAIANIDLNKLFLIQLRDSIHTLNEFTAINYDIIEYRYVSVKEGHARQLYCSTRNKENIHNYTKLLISELGKPSKKANTLKWKKTSIKDYRQSKLQIQFASQECVDCPGDNDLSFTISVKDNRATNLFETEEDGEAVKKYFQEKLDEIFVHGVDFELLEKKGKIRLLNGEPYTGRCVGYFKTGEKGLKTSYQDGKRHGHCIYWYRKGQIKMEGNFINGRLHGTLKYWYENGQIKSHSKHYLGKLEGYNTYYYKSGKLFKETYYENGKPIARIMYNKRGKIIKNDGVMKRE